MAAVEPLMIECPECHEHIHIQLRLRLSSVREGNLTFDVEPDLTDIWAHAWTHTTGGTGDE